MARRSGLLRAALVSLVTVGLFSGCQDDPEPPDQSSLRRSGAAAFICVGPGGEGAPLSRCPQGPRATDGGLTTGDYGYELLALVTQTVSAEVAVIRVAGVSEDGLGTGKVLDADASNPGVTPLRIGQKPTGIASTPGGKATFVGVSEVGKPGIFGLPTSCVYAPAAGETVRDLTTWPACSLPSAPGDMVVLVDPADSEGRLRRWCGGAYESVQDLAPRPAASRDECAVDLFAETAEPGTRKLAVSLPAEGRIVILDAQALLDRPPGSFESCLGGDVLLGEAPLFETELPLEVNLPPSIVQPVPDDLIVEGCTQPGLTYGPFPGPFSPRPSGMAALDGALLIADRGAPVVHVVDVFDPCVPTELSPFIATSVDEPERVVTTTKVAISPKTPAGRRYVYAIDERGEEHASIMVFDFTPGATSRTPLIRPGSAEMPLEPPDRIEFASPVKDVSFALFDQPNPDPITGSGVVGLKCDPSPFVSDDSPEGRYRPQDATTGARPAMLRGLFGYALLGNGNLSIIDIDDFDAECRRPVTTNPDAVEDFRGCAGDSPDIPYLTLDGAEDSRPNTTDEVSCQTVSPHRARSGNLLKVADSSTSGTPARAPALNSFGGLSLSGRALPPSRLTPDGRKRPILLGVDFDGTPSRPVEPAQVYVGSTLRTRGDINAPLITNPNLAEQVSMVLPFRQPRAYPDNESVTVTYEGSYGGRRRTGRLPAVESLDPSQTESTFGDTQALFCDLGVQDENLTREVGQQKFGLSSGALERFVDRHADYVQITSELLDETDPYWKDADGGASCGGGGGFVLCDSVFGDGDKDDLVPARDLRILRAYQDHLEVRPRGTLDDDETAITAMSLLSCCFPEVVEYRLRAGRQWVVLGERTGFEHSVHAVESVDPTTGEVSYPCEFDCNPLRAQGRGRAYELTNTACEVNDAEDSLACGVGPVGEDDVVCAYDASRGAVSPGGTASECIFDGRTRRFAVYRGLEPSKRGMSFAFQVNGGFTNQGVALVEAVETTNVLPVFMTPIPEFGALGIVDSQDRGLILVDIRTATVAGYYY